MSLAESLAWVVLDVLGHLCVRVEADLAEADSLSLLISGRVDPAICHHRRRSRVSVLV